MNNLNPSRTLPLRAGRLAVACVFGLAAISCRSAEGGGNPVGVSPTVVGIQVSGLATLIVGQSMSYAAVESLSDGTTRPITSGTWGTDAAAVVSISSTGRVTALNPGQATIFVDAAGRRGTLLLAVYPAMMGTWSGPYVVNAELPSGTCNQTTCDVEYSAATYTVEASITSQTGGTLSGTLTLVGPPSALSIPGIVKNTAIDGSVTTSGDLVLSTAQVIAVGPACTRTASTDFAGNVTATGLTAQQSHVWECRLFTSRMEVTITLTRQ